RSPTARSKTAPDWAIFCRLAVNADPVPKSPAKVKIKVLVWAQAGRNPPPGDDTTKNITRPTARTIRDRTTRPRGERETACRFVDTDIVKTSLIKFYTTYVTAQAASGSAQPRPSLLKRPFDFAQGSRFRTGVKGEADCLLIATKYHRTRCRPSGWHR